MSENLEKLEAVFYSHPVPGNLTTLTFLGLVFDRVHFPNVYLPTDGFDPEKLEAEIERIHGTGLNDHGTRLLLAMMSYVLIPEVREFCYFTGKHGQLFGGDKMDGVKDLVDALERQIHGPPRPNFTPIYTPGYHKGISEDEYIDYPGDYFYQCNALLYAAENGIPLINADPNMPVPAIGGEPAKNNAKLLSSIIAMECVNLVLPEIREMQPTQILEVREEISKYIAPFRISMLRLSAHLNRAIDSDCTYDEIVDAAKLVTKTEVYPALLELKNEIERPRKGWLSRSWDLAKVVPRLVTSYATLDLEKALPQTVEALGNWLVAGASKHAPRSEYYYLLKLEEAARK